MSYGLGPLPRPSSTGELLAAVLIGGALVLSAQPQRRTRRAVNMGTTATAKKSAKKRAGGKKAGAYIKLSASAKKALDSVEEAGIGKDAFVSNAIVSHANSEKIQQAIKTLTSNGIEQSTE